MLLDVVMLTKNSAKPSFEKCLISIKANVPVNRLIVIDAYSTDNTLDIINKFFPNSIIIQTKQPLARARKLGVSYVETEWFAFIDSDILLFPEWFKIVGDLRGEGIGGIQGAYQYANESLLKYLKWQENIWKKKFLRKKNEPLSIVDVNNFKKKWFRGLTHNTLIRTSCIKDWDPPAHLHIGEDHHLLLHVIKKGYKWLVVHTPVCKHYAFLNLTETMHRGFVEAQEVKKITRRGYIERDEMWIDATAMNYLKLLGFSFWKGLVASLYEKDPRILLYKMCFYGSMLLGHFIPS